MAVTVAIDALRARIREIEGVTAVAHGRIHTGEPAWDHLLGGVPAPGIVEIAGVPGSGRIRSLVAALRGFLGQHSLSAWVDPRRRLNPLGLESLGLDLPRTLIVRPPADREGFVIEQICRSGCFAAVVVVDPTLTGRAALRWSHAAEAGRCTLFALHEATQRGLSATVRLGIDGLAMEVQRDRQGAPFKSAQLPEWPAQAIPW